MSDKRKWVPEIMYEEYEEDSLSGGLPFIQVPNDKEMPDIIFMFGSQETGEFEPDLSSLSSGINVFYLLVWRCLKVKSSVSRTDGSEEKVYR